jgi:hypothetical protein
MTMLAFSDIAPCSLFEVQYIGVLEVRTASIIKAYEAVLTSITSAYFNNDITRSYIPEL